VTVEVSRVNIVVGPVSHESAVAWLDYAAEVLEHFRGLDEPPLPESVLDEFEELVGEWRDIARKPGPFHWEIEESAERAEFLINALFQAGEAVEKEEANGEMRLRPAEADEFHIRTIDGVLAALVSEGPPYSQFAEEMRDMWGLAQLH